MSNWRVAESDKNLLRAGTPHLGRLPDAAFRKHIRKTLRSARGCSLEFSFRDIYSLGGRSEKPRRAVQIGRELVEGYWG